MSVNNSANKILEEIYEIKKRLGKKLLILTHHYQTDQIVSLGSFAGDSFDLSQKAASDKEAEFIIFCGVHFMAESAAILSASNQTVQIPEISAGCPMADMADIQSVKKAFSQLEAIVGTKTTTPIVYMNSSALIKAFCGKNKGLVCTSSNADKAFDYALKRREKIFFFPDEHLGKNAADKLGIAPELVILWDSNKKLGGYKAEDIKKAKVIVWNGYCPIHIDFTTSQILKARRDFPEAKIIVHPECQREVVKISDASGSTAYIIEYVKNAAKNSIIFIGTEINLIKRLARRHPDKKIIPLYASGCKDMFKINLKNLLKTLKKPGAYNLITIPDEIKKDAKKALDRMLTLT
ncbi:MAG: quinolinate synthase NadA [Deltaproteobacteria bacterium]|nr:quinolinate synthase NadA [Deltaproteobacteria bacterium]